LVAARFNLEFGRVDAESDWPPIASTSLLFVFLCFCGQLFFQKKNCHKKHKRHNKMRELKQEGIVATVARNRMYNASAPMNPASMHPA
jgi:hypothetical protein